MAGSRYSDAETTEGDSLLLLLRGRNEYFLARSWENDLEEALVETYQAKDSLRDGIPLGNLGPIRMRDDNRVFQKILHFQCKRKKM